MINIRLSCLPPIWAVVKSLKGYKYNITVLLTHGGQQDQVSHLVKIKFCLFVCSFVCFSTCVSQCVCACAPKWALCAVTQIQVTAYFLWLNSTVRKQSSGCQRLPLTIFLRLNVRTSVSRHIEYNWRHAVFVPV